MCIYNASMSLYCLYYIAITVKHVGFLIYKIKKCKFIPDVNMQWRPGKCPPASHSHILTTSRDRLNINTTSIDTYLFLCVDSIKCSLKRIWYLYIPRHIGRLNRSLCARPVSRSSLCLELRFKMADGPESRSRLPRSNSLLAIHM
jgi:hypothetical protein